jgi:hypothetical protein
LERFRRVILPEGGLGGFATGAENRFVVHTYSHPDGLCRATVRVVYLRIMPLPPRSQQQPDLDWRPFAFAGGVGFALAFALAVFGALFIR